MKKHNHREAFCLMLYASDDGAEQEWLWNSRDGVTPFIIASRDGTKNIKHVEWNRDTYAPYYKPLRGQRYFADMTLAFAREKAIGYVEKYWDHPEIPMRVGFASKDEAVKYYADAWARPGAPTVLVAE